MAAEAPRAVRLTTSDGLGVSGWEGGPSAGPVVVLLAGWPQTVYAWRRVQPLLAEAGVRSLALDLPGMGGSDLLPEGAAYDTGRVAGLLAWALAEAGVDRHALVGHDVGAWTAYAWATQHPRGVDTLCLLDALIPGVTPDAAFGLANAPRLFQFYFNAVGELPELLTEGREREFLGWFFRSKSAVKTAVSETDLDLYAESYRRPGRMSAGFGYYRAVPTDMEQNRAAPPPAMPVLALGGEHAVGDRLLHTLKASSPQVQGGVLPGIGHYIPEEAPEALVERLLPFIRAGAASPA